MPQGELSSADASTWSLKLPQFEGPLDLLLALCLKHELNILDIPIAFVTEKYLEHLALMQALQLDVAADYLVMAATLAHIKSRMLLPAEASEPDDETLAADEIDPREALIRRLLEYQKYKDAGDQLAARGIAGRDVFARGGAIDLGNDAGAPPLAQVPLFALLDAFQQVLERAKIKLSHDVVNDRITMSDRMSELSRLLAVRGQVLFHELFEEHATKFDLVITFLALLEMSRLKMTRLRQSEPFGPLQIELAGDATLAPFRAEDEQTGCA